MNEFVVLQVGETELSFFIGKKELIEYFEDNFLEADDFVVYNCITGLPVYFEKTTTYKLTEKE